MDLSRIPHPGTLEEAGNFPDDFPDTSNALWSGWYVENGLRFPALLTWRGLMLHRRLSAGVLEDTTKVFRPSPQNPPKIPLGGLDNRYILTDPHSSAPSELGAAHLELDSVTTSARWISLKDAEPRPGQIRLRYHQSPGDTYPTLYRVFVPDEPEPERWRTAEVWSYLLRMGRRDFWPTGKGRYCTKETHMQLMLADRGLLLALYKEHKDVLLEVCGIPTPPIPPSEGAPLSPGFRHLEFD